MSVDLSSHAQEPCKKCAHPFDDHLLHGEGPAPRSGYMTCPVKDCPCYRTWSAEYKE